MTTRISRPCHLSPPKLSVLCVSAQHCDNRFPSFLPLSPCSGKNPHQTTPSLTYLNATPTNQPTSGDSKPLTQTLSLLDATYKRTGGQLGKLRLTGNLWH